MSRSVSSDGHRRASELGKLRLRDERHAMHRIGCSAYPDNRHVGRPCGPTGAERIDFFLDAMPNAPRPFRR
jgi:hypothetical protein